MKLLMVNKIRRVFSILLLCLFFSFLFCACSKKEENRVLAHGKYYLDDSQEIYIEIQDDEYLQFVGVDFSFVDPETFWGEDSDLDKDIDINACMEGRKKYIFWVDNAITVELIEGDMYGFIMQYDGKNTITFNKLKYILRLVFDT